MTAVLPEHLAASCVTLESSWDFGGDVPCTWGCCVGFEWHHSEPCCDDLSGLGLSTASGLLQLS